MSNEVKVGQRWKNSVGFFYAITGVCAEGDLWTGVICDSTGAPTSSTTNGRASFLSSWCKLVSDAPAPQVAATVEACAWPINGGSERCTFPCGHEGKHSGSAPNYDAWMAKQGGGVAKLLEDRRRLVAALSSVRDSIQPFVDDCGPAVRDDGYCGVCDEVNSEQPCWHVVAKGIVGNARALLEEVSQ